MKTVKTLINIVCLLAVICICQAQNRPVSKSVIAHEPIKETDFSQPAIKPQSGGLASTRQLPGIPGSPYLFDEWNDVTGTHLSDRGWVPELWTEMND